jgi:hypothetical protein
MVSLHPSVDVQLDELSARIKDYIEEQLFERTNYEFWHEMEHIDIETIHGIYTAFDLAFGVMLERYRFAPQVSGVLKGAKILMRSCVNVAMNNFYPHGLGPFEYMDRVIHNTMDAYYENIYNNLRIEMIASNHAAHIVQRSFRKCFTDPSYKMCRRRLTQEFEEYKASVSNINIK